MANPLSFFPRLVLRCLPANERGFLCSHNGVAPSWPTQSSYRIPPGRCKDKFGGDAERFIMQKVTVWFRRFKGDSKVWGALTKKLTGYHLCCIPLHRVAWQTNGGFICLHSWGLDFCLHGSVSHIMLYSFRSLHALLCSFQLCFMEAESLRWYPLNPVGCSFLLRPCFDLN